MKLVIIPGAYSSPIVWTYFSAEMPKNIETIYLEYSPEIPLEEILKSFQKKLSEVNDDVIVIGHSLGGVLSLALSHRCNKVKKLITIAAPFGGVTLSRGMVYVSMFMTPFNNLWRNTHPENKILVDIRGKDPIIDTTAFIVETQNSTMWFEPSDGVVSVSSQKALGSKKNLRYENIYCTHADAMLHPDFISKVRKIIT
jgi:pimeloyl-ACP methyl ester carboxylesterase